jgi:RNA polymerase sigma factor (sigma-70 family)
MLKITKVNSSDQEVILQLDGQVTGPWVKLLRQSAEVVQEAYLRAFRHFGSFRGGDGRPWLLAIVRNTCYTWMQNNRSPELSVPLDDEVHEIESKDSNPEALLLQRADTQMVRQALEDLPVEFREVIVLRELEGLSYEQIADVAEIPVGTVMSRLARARKRLQTVASRRNEETSGQLAVAVL